jgi:hypothetical protein
VLFDLYLWDGPRALGLYDRYLALTPAGDPTVRKWIADLNNRIKRGGTAPGSEQTPHQEKE